MPSQIRVVRSTEMGKGEFTEGIVRDKAFEAEGVLFARSRIAGGVKSGWHHHGKRKIYGFIVSGRLRFEYEGGKNPVTVDAGDFFHIPVGLVHRDVNPNKHQEAVVVNIFLGRGPPVVNVPEPQLQRRRLRGNPAED